MEVIVDQGNEVEEVLLQPKRVIQHFTNTTTTYVEVPIPSGVPSIVQVAVVQRVAISMKALEIAKSIVYGGFTQLLASLAVVISAASADATISSIVKLALANLVGGLFMFIHNIQELKAENKTKAAVDRYKELLGERKNYSLHAFIAVISFIVFGLVPPLVYTFSFHDNGDNDLNKLGAVVIASLLCITLLSIAKAYTKNSNTFEEYSKTVFGDLSNGARSILFTYFKLSDDSGGLKQETTEGTIKDENHENILEVGDSIILPASNSPSPEIPKVESIKAMEVVKSIVYGGLIESLASLTVVTTAACADSTILSILALTLANLISGLFIFIHKYYLQLGELKVEEHQREASMDQYNELLRKRKNLYLHAFITIISFIVFGLVPPLVYGFSFHDNGDNDFKKLGAVAVASLLCITLLSIAKAYTKNSNTFEAYFKTVIYYVISGVVCLVLSYLAGDLVKILIEKVSWLEPSSNLGLHVQGMSVQKTEWNSY